MRKWILSLLLFLFWIMTLQAQSGFVSVQGKFLVDTTGQELILRGYGLGGWLVPEGYMLHVPGYGSPTDIRNKIIDLVGAENATQFYRAYEQNYVAEKDIELIKSWGFNSIRLPFHFEKFYDLSTGQLKAEGFQIIDRLLAWCRKYGLYLIPDMHCAPGGQNKYNISDSDGQEARLWTDRANQLATFKIWKEIARRYKDEKAIAGYDLINEPVLPDGYSNTVLYNFYKELTDTIRTVDQNHILFIEGNWFATDFGQLTPPYDPLWVYSFHKYWNATDQGTIQYLLNIRNQYNVPLWLGETGENSNTWFYEVKTLMENQKIGWCWWAHKKVRTTTSPLSAVLNPGYQAILDYWNGNGPRPSVPNALNALMELADNLRAEKCEFRPGVIASLMDPDYNRISKPLKNHTIPGVIYAVDYDLGNVGVAYQDRTVKNTSGSPNHEWNVGAEYRNDGVDIEKCSDSQGNGYNVGWIESSEWLQYTVGVSEHAFYRFIFRVSSGGSGGKLSVILDNSTILATINIPGTGGWQNWIDVQLDSVELPQGTHTIRLYTSTGGFNLNMMTIQYLASSINGETGNLLKKFHIDKVYPNPFNASSTIRYYLPETGNIRLEVYNSAGQVVKILVDEKKSLGFHTIVWDAADSPSGIYMVNLKAGSNVMDSKKLVLVK